MAKVKSQQGSKIIHSSSMEPQMFDTHVSTEQTKHSCTELDEQKRLRENGVPEVFIVRKSESHVDVVDDDDGEAASLLRTTWHVKMFVRRTQDIALQCEQTTASTLQTRLQAFRHQRML